MREEGDTLSDKKFLNTVRLRLLKEGRIRDILNIKDRGYSFSKVTDGIFELGIATKNHRREVKLVLDENDPDLGYQIMKVKHRRGKYTKPRKDNDYEITELSIKGTGDSEAILYLAEVDRDRLNSPNTISRHLQGGEKYKSMLKEGIGYGLYSTKKKFSSWEDYVEFCKVGYRVFKETETDYQLFLEKRKSNLRKQIKDLQKEIDKIEEYEKEDRAD